MPTSPSRRLFPLLALLPYLAPYRLRALLALGALLLAAAATLSLPLAFRLLLDHGFSAGSQVNLAFVTLFAVACVLAAATAARFYLVSWLGERVTADLRSQIYHHIVHLSPATFETMQTGEVLSRLSTDTTLVQTVIGTSLSMGLRNLLLLTGGLVMLTLTSPQLSGWILLTLLLVVAPIVFFGRRVRTLSRQSQDKLAGASAIAGEVLAAIPTVQAYTQETREAARFDDAVEAGFGSALSRIRARSQLTLLVILLIFGAIVFVLWLGAQAVIAGQLSAGKLGQFVLYAVVTAGAAGALAEVWGDLARAAGATERLMELLALQSAVGDSGAAAAAPPAAATLTLQGVGFTYPSRPQQPALSDISLTIRAGEQLALVGPSGAGKTTLFQLLLRFYDPQHGQILLGERPLRTLPLATLRSQLGVVLQETVIFALSARENIRYGKPEASDAEVEAAAQAAAADEFIRALPDGYDTFLGERGVRLSGGQRQRIAIARAILKNPPILLLDEATSALDAASEQLVQQALERATRHRTTLVIAHRLATVLKADRIVVMDAGRIVAEGTHHTLLASSPLYARLAALQFGQMTGD